MSEPIPAKNSDLPSLVALTLGLGVLLVIVGIFGNDAMLARIVQYFSTSVPIIMGFAFMTKRQAINDDKTNQTASSVGSLAGSLNGKLDARFKELETRIVDKVENTRTTVEADPVTGDIVLTSGKDNSNA